MSGIVNESLTNYSEISRIQDILCRYLPSDEKRRSRRYNVQPWQQFNFIFTIPKEESLITGEIKTISSGGLSFLPDHSNLIKKMYLFDKFPDCSLRAGDALLSPICRLVRTGRILSMEFLGFPDNEQQILDDYLLNSPILERRMREAARKEKV